MCSKVSHCQRNYVKLSKIFTNLDYYLQTLYIVYKALGTLISNWFACVIVQDVS